MNIITPTAQASLETELFVIIGTWWLSVTWRGVGAHLEVWRGEGECIELISALIATDRFEDRMMGRFIGRGT